MKTLWTGSDVLYATKFPKHSKKSKWIYMFCFRIFVKLADIFCEQHYVVSEHLIAELKPLKLKKRISVLVDPPLYTKKYKKVKHKGFNVLYYRGLGGNQKFKDWVYGKDVIDEIERRFSKLVLNTDGGVSIEYGINIIEVNGKSDMSKIYPIIDFMVRPNRHDGCPRMVMECEINNIPYYWSKENPDIDEILRMIQNEKDKRNSNHTIPYIVYDTRGFVLAESEKTLINRGFLSIAESDLTEILKRAYPNYGCIEIHNPKER